MARTRDETARGRVLDSARDLVSRFDPRAVTVDEIAAAAGEKRRLSTGGGRRSRRWRRGRDLNAEPGPHPAGLRRAA
jgi:hypothetical protein